MIGNSGLLNQISVKHDSAWLPRTLKYLRYPKRKSEVQNPEKLFFKTKIIWELAIYYLINMMLSVMDVKRKIRKKYFSCHEKNS